MATSNAPAGQSYRDVEHAGECTLQENADSFPDTNISSMIPQMFKTQYPEPVDENTGELVKSNRILTKKEENRFIGMTRNADGEEAEYQVFKVLEQLVRSENNPPFLIIRNYVLQNFRAKVLNLDIGINFGSIHTVAEFDAVMVVKDIGVILTEVKRQFTEEQQTKAEDQLENGKLFFERCMSHFIGSTFQFPILKVIIFPKEKSPSPLAKSARDSYIFHKDMLANFSQKWKELVSKLSMLKGNSIFGSHDFRRFVRVITGTWCMELYQKRFYRYNTKEANPASQLQHNDDMVKRAIFTSDVRTAKDESKVANPVVDVELCRPRDGYPRCDGMDLIYLTPEQRDIFQNVPHAIIRGPAGSGKTLLFNLKIVDIMQNYANKNILIVAPEPHHKRMEKHVTSNGGKATICDTLPSKNSGVIVMSFKNFFGVTPNNHQLLRSYDVSGYHLFIDDLQKLDLEWPARITFTDVVQFIEQVYANLLGSDTIFWCNVDEGQSWGIDVDNKRVTSLFNTDKVTSRYLAMPSHTFDKILRNSVEISAVVQKIRALRIVEEKAASRILTNHHTGHRIRSESVIYHKLTKWNGYTGMNNPDWKVHGIGFAVKRVKEEIASLLTAHSNTMKRSDIAVLYDSWVGPLEPIRNMLILTFNIDPQTIEQYEETNNDLIIFDSHSNVASFECACVLFLCGLVSPGNCPNYNIMSRARSKLVVVDFGALQEPPLITDDVVMVKWEERKGLFYKI